MQTMNIICVSRGSRTHGKKFAETLAAKLGYLCLGREDLFEEAVKRRIPIGKLETAIVMRRDTSEALSIELEHYKALATSLLCGKALENNIVYHGRIGHLLLPGVEHILKIRVVIDMESRISLVTDKLNIPLKKARQYIESVEDDRRSWVRRFYNVDWDLFTLYDMVLNLSHVSVPNAALAVCSMAQLPEFQPTPATAKVLQDLLVGSRCRLQLAEDERTRRLNVKVRAGGGTVHVTYPNGAVKGVEHIPEVIGGIEGVLEVVCTAAETNILWIQEAFEPEGPSYGSVMEIAAAWDAAVELVKFTPGDVEGAAETASDSPVAVSSGWRETGIIDDEDRSYEDDTSDIARLYARLISDGKAGRKLTLQGSRKTLVNAIDRAASYRLIILDGIFLDKGASTRKRLITEWSNVISDSLKTPVLTIDQIVSRYHFGPKQATKMVVSAVLAGLSVYSVFHFDRQILEFLSRPEMKWRIAATAAIALFVPFFAQVYSTVTSSVLKLFKFD
jgi:cytidylate kinase